MEPENFLENTIPRKGWVYVKSFYRGYERGLQGRRRGGEKKEKINETKFQRTLRRAS